MNNSTEILKQNFLPFAKYVLQTRALPNDDDCLKTGARYILYAFIKNNYTKLTNGVGITGSIMNYNPHGNAAIWENVCHLASPRLTRYPLLVPEGNIGSTAKGYDFAADRYLKLKIDPKMKKLILNSNDLVDEWEDNYLETEKIPCSLPTYFPMFVNGWLGIGVGMASCLPSFNIKEVINSCKRYLANENIDRKELLCLPDFPSGCDITNQSEILESLSKGTGKAVVMRAKYSIKDNIVKFTNFPLSVFPARIMGELEQLEQEGKIPLVKNYIDTSSKIGEITIIFEKNITPLRLEKEINFLYKNTSLVEYCGININMLKDNRKPTRYTFTDILINYTEKVKRLKTKEFQIVLKEVKKKMEIREGYLRIIDNIDAIIQALKEDWTNEQILTIYPFTELQLEKLLEFKLKQLKKLEKQKIENELKDLNDERIKIEEILNSEELLKKEVIKTLDEVISIYGDDRRSNIIIPKETLNNKKIYEKKNYTISIYQDKSIKVLEGKETSKKRTSKGKKSDVLKKIEVTNLDILLVFRGDNVLPTTVENLEDLENVDFICKVNDKDDDIIIVTTKYIKRTKMSEYIKGKEKKSLKLEDNDKIIFIGVVKDNQTIALTDGINVTTVRVIDISPTGKTAKGVIAMKSPVVSACIAEEELIIVEKENIKRINMDEIPSVARPSKGVKAGDEIICITSSDRLYIKDDSNGLIVESKDFPLVKRTAKGIKKEVKMANGI